MMKTIKRKAPEEQLNLLLKPMENKQQMGIKETETLLKVKHNMNAIDSKQMRNIINETLK